jgi:glycosyltransferase involved in cell wall biosynthesis
MRLAVLAGGDPSSVRTWSGTPYFMTKALRTRFPDLLIVHSPRPPWHRYVRHLTLKLTGGHIDIEWSSYLARRDAKQIATLLKANGVDVLLAIANSTLSSLLAAQIPTIHVSDATVPLMRDYYAEFKYLPRILARNAFEFDSKSVLRSRACLYPTEWAARSAIRDYGADPSRVHAIPWGANIDRTRSQKLNTPDGICHLVFIGVDWERKGGSIAVEATRKLVAAGHPVRLHIIGVTPKLPMDDAIIVHGFIDKRTESGQRRFDDIMRQAAFLFVPTRQECFGIVFPEANSYGVPAITAKTGGVPDAVQEGVSGHLLPIDASAGAYSDLIWSIWSDRLRYERLRESSRSRFDEVLNWNSWLMAVSPIIDAVNLSKMVP